MKRHLPMMVAWLGAFALLTSQCSTVLAAEDKVLADAVTTHHCPPRQFLQSVDCSCSFRGRVVCNDVRDEEHLRLIMAVCRGYPLKDFTLRGASLEWLPSDLFTPISTRGFTLSYSRLKSLAKPGEGTSLFRGSGISAFVLDSTSIDDEDLSHLRDLDNLEQLAILGMRGSVFVSQLTRSLEGVPLVALAFDRSTGLVWSKGVFDVFDQLAILSLSGVGLTDVSRSTHLPASVGFLEHLRLSKNNLTSLPGGFLDGLHELRTIDLSENRISVLDERTFRYFNGYLDIHGNPLACDSRIDWLRRRFHEGTIRMMTLHKTFCADGSLLFADGSPLDKVNSVYFTDSDRPFGIPFKFVDAHLLLN